MSKKGAPAMPAEVDDEFAGQGGSFLLDPESGRRTLRERTAEVGEAVPNDGSDNLKEQENGTTEA